MVFFQALRQLHSIFARRALFLLVFFAGLFTSGYLLTERGMSSDTATFGVMALGLFGTTVLSSLVTRERRGESPGVVTLAADSARRAPFVFINTIIAGLGAMMLGICIVPGIMVACSMALIVPLSMNERKSPFHVLQRSAELTRHHRWSIFGFLAIVSIGGYMLMMSLFDGMRGSFSFRNAERVLLLISGVSWLYVHSLMTALYHELSAYKDGISTKLLGAKISV